MINWIITKQDGDLITKIAKRALAKAEELGIQYDMMTATMDITACHLNGCPLKLTQLLNADNFNFVHDVFGIRQHINRETGELEDCFVPRYAS